jgi:hypothetical protein
MLLSQAVFTVDLPVMTSEEPKSGEEHRTHIYHIYPHTCIPLSRFLLLPLNSFGNLVFEAFRSKSDHILF